MAKNSKLLSCLFFFIITTYAQAFSEKYYSIAECAIKETNQVFTIIVKSHYIHHITEANFNEVVALVLKHPFNNQTDEAYAFSLSRSKETLYLYREPIDKGEMLSEEINISLTKSTGVINKYRKNENILQEQYSLYCVPSEFFSLNWLSH